MSALNCVLVQDSIGTRSVPFDVSCVNSPPSPAKSTERVMSEEQKVVKLKPQALVNVTSETLSTMSPPPAKRLALSAKKVSLINTKQLEIRNQLYYMKTLFAKTDVHVLFYCD